MITSVLQLISRIKSIIYSMLSQVHIQIVSKLTEIILQTRLDVKKALFNHLHSLFSSFKTQAKNRPASLYELLAVLLLKDSYHIKQKLGVKLQGGRLSSKAAIHVLFTLTQRSTGNKIDAQSWVVYVTRKKIQKSHQSVSIVAQFFEEAVLILNKLPLFSVYQKDRQLKTRYFLDYKIQYDNFKDYCLFQQRGQNFIQRESDSLALYAKVSYCPCINVLNKMKIQLAARQKRKQSATSDYQGDRKVSVYAFYDPELDFTFLSSDQQNFKIAGSESEQIKMELGNEQISQEFELLISNEDEQFLNDTQQYFDVLLKNEKAYLFE